MIFFTDNYQDRSTNDGYQFEFFCRRCGNGYSSSFQHSATGFGGRMLRLGGDLIGGQVGERAAQLGWDAEWMRDGNRGSTRDKALAKAVDEMKPYFHQCHRCGQWVCEQVCWNDQRGLCTTCAPKLDQEIAGMQAAAQVSQLNHGHVPVLRPGKRRREVLPGLRSPAGRRGVGEEVLRELRDGPDRGEVLQRVRDADR
jgi:hypothetical protein